MAVFDHVRKVAERHHDVYAMIPFEVRLASLICSISAVDIGLLKVPGETVLLHTDARRRDDADPALVGNRRRKAGQRDANAHAACMIGSLAFKLPMIRSFIFDISISLSSSFYFISYLYVR